MSTPKCPKCSLPMEFGWKPELFTREGKAYSYTAVWKCCCGGERAYRVPMPTRRARKAVARSVAKPV